MAQSINAHFFKQLYARSGRDETKAVAAIKIAVDIELDDAGLRFVK
jgi:hypothetical protein